MATTNWQRRQFDGSWDQDESENYFPEPLPPIQRARLPDLADQPVGIHLGGGRRGRLVTFYRNGDPHFKGLSASISQKAFVSMESLLVWLTEKIPTTAGVRHVFRLPDGRPVRSVAEFQPGGHYVVSSVRRLVRGPDYGGGEAAPDQRPWQAEARQPGSVAGNMRHADIRLLARPGRGAAGSDGLRPLRQQQQQQQLRSSLEAGSGPRLVRLITVVSNTHRSSREKVLVNPGTRLNFEDLLADFTSLLVMSGPPVRALYTACPPYRRVESFSQLFREFKDHDTFIACGRELSPVELSAGPAKRDATGSDSSGGATPAAARTGGAAAAAVGTAATTTERSSPRKLWRKGDDEWQQG